MPYVMRKIAIKKRKRTKSTIIFPIIIILGPVFMLTSNTCSRIFRNTLYVFSFHSTSLGNTVCSIFPRVVINLRISCNLQKLIVLIIK